MNNKQYFKCLVIADKSSDFTDILASCGVEIDICTQKEALSVNLTDYDAFCVLACGAILDPRLRVLLEE